MATHVAASASSMGRIARAVTVDRFMAWVVGNSGSRRKPGVITGTVVSRQDLTRINTDYADVRRFAPWAVTPPTARLVSQLSLFKDLGTHGMGFPRSSSHLGSLRADTLELRGR